MHIIIKTKQKLYHFLHLESEWKSLAAEICSYTWRVSISVSTALPNILANASCDPEFRNQKWCAIRWCSSNGRTTHSSYRAPGHRTPATSRRPETQKDWKSHKIWFDQLLIRSFDASLSCPCGLAHTKRNACTEHGSRYSHHFLELIIKVSWPTAPISIDDAWRRHRRERTRTERANETQRCERMAADRGNEPDENEIQQKIIIMQTILFSSLRFFFAFVRSRIFSFQHKRADSVENMIQYCVLCVRSRCWLPCAIAVRVCAMLAFVLLSMCVHFSVKVLLHFAATLNIRFFSQCYSLSISRFVFVCVNPEDDKDAMLYSYFQFSFPLSLGNFSMQRQKSMFRLHMDAVLDVTNFVTPERCTEHRISQRLSSFFRWNYENRVCAEWCTRAHNVSAGNDTRWMTNDVAINEYK